MRLIIIFIVIILIFTMGCSAKMTNEEQTKADKYQREYVYVAEELELKEKSYVKTFEFIAQTSTDDRFYANLFYATIGHISFFDTVKMSNIKKSLDGLNFKLYDKSNKQLIYSYSITKETSLLNSLGLGPCNISIIKGHKYIVEVSVPARGDTKELYLKPTLIVGILLPPQL